MTANVWADKCVHSFGEVPWHKFCDACEIPMPATEVLEKEWDNGAQIYLRPLRMELDGEEQETGDFGIVRGKASFDTHECKFGYVTKRFKPIQYRDVTLMFDTMVNQPVETAGILDRGKKIFISWKMPEFAVGVGDEYVPYAIVTVGMDNINGGKLFTSIFRPVCENTVSFAENWAKSNTEQGKGMIFKGTKVDPEMLKKLGYWMKFLQANAVHEVALVEDLFKSLTKTPIKNEAHVHELLYRAYPVGGQVDAYFPPELRADKQESLDEKGKTNELLRDNIYSLFAGRGTGIDTSSLMGLFNATSETLCHYMPSKKDIASSILFGNRQATMSQMVEVLRTEATK
jgi:hypothetical protein